MAPSVAPTAVNFYTAKDFGGSTYPYKVGDDVSLDKDLNDKFLSVNVGLAAKVLAWRDYNKGGPYEEWSGGPRPDITSIGGLSQFMVIDADTRAIAFLFRDATGGADRQYSLKVDAHDVGEVTMFSNDGDEHRLAGLMPAGGPPVTTAIYVRDEKSGVYIATRSVFFKWNDQTDREYSRIHPASKFSVVVHVEADVFT